MIINQNYPILAQTTDILRLLTVDDFKKLRQASRQRRFFGNERVYNLYMALRSHYPAFEVSPTDIRKIYSKVFPQKKFSAYRLEKVFTELNKTTEAYLLWLEYEKDSAFKKKMRALALADRSLLFDLFAKSVDFALSETEIHHDPKTSAFWYMQSELLDLMYAHKQHDKYDTKDTTLDRLNSACDRFFAFSVGLAELKNESSEKFKSHFSEEVTEVLAKKELS